MVLGSKDNVGGGHQRRHDGVRGRMEQRRWLTHAVGVSASNHSMVIAKTGKDDGYYSFDSAKLGLKLRLRVCMLTIESEVKRVFWICYFNRSIK